MIPPIAISGAKLLQYLISTKEHRSLGNTMHNIKLKDVKLLAICSYPEEEGVYLFYCNEKWREITDTWHPSIKEALSQADFEFIGLKNDWIKI